MNILEVRNLKVYLGEMYIIQGVSLNARRGAVTAIIGRNGSGKTTLMRTIAGLIRPAHGEVIFKGVNIVGLPPHKVSRLGITYVPAERAIFGELTVKENLKLAFKGRKGEFSERLQTVLEVFPDLKKFLNHHGRSLSGGQQKMLAIACGLISEPELLMLDEPSEGLSPKIIPKIFNTIAALKTKTTILLVEQNYSAIKMVSDYIYIMDKGVIVAEGEADKISSQQDLLKKYLGVAI